MNRFSILFIVFFGFVAATSASATTHIVKFGGRKYTPKTLTVAVGDTIIWQGDFEEHPLTLTSAPKGAPGFAHIEKGSSFRYVVTVAGNYNYICDEHEDEGMVGSFTATASH